MPITLYSATVPTFTHAFKMLAAVLKKAEEHVVSTGAEGGPDALASKRLIADMLPLTFQIQGASNTAKKSMWRLSGGKLAAESWADDETTLEQLQARIAKTLALLESVDEAEINAMADKDVELALGPKKTTLNAGDYVFAYALPNFFFHVQTAYAIVRVAGVPVGKTDYLRPFLGPYMKEESQS